MPLLLTALHARENNRLKEQKRWIIIESRVSGHNREHEASGKKLRGFLLLLPTMNRDNRAYYC